MWARRLIVGDYRRSEHDLCGISYQKQRRRVLGSEMAYVEAERATPSCCCTATHLVVPLAQRVAAPAALGRCIAPDLIGMGDSDKLPNSGPGSYRFVEHRRYLDALLEGLDVRERVTLVVHDWGSALGFDWANRHREAVKGIAYMEAIVGPQYWDPLGQVRNASSLAGAAFEAGEEMVLRDNFFIEKILPGGHPAHPLRRGDGGVPTAIRRAREGRRPTLTWPRQIPIEGEPADVVAITNAYADWLATSSVPQVVREGRARWILAHGAVLDSARRFPAQT